MPFAHISCLFHWILCVSAHSFRVCALSHLLARHFSENKNATEYYKWMRLWIVTPSICCFAWETKNNEPLFFCSPPFARSLRASVASRNTVNCENRTLAIRTKEQLGGEKENKPIERHHRFWFFGINTSSCICEFLLLSFCRMEWNACMPIQMEIASAKGTHIFRSRNGNASSRANTREIGECETATATVTAAEKMCCQSSKHHAPTPLPPSHAPMQLRQW